MLGQNNAGHESVIRLYAGGILEVARVLKKKGVLVCKCQDETQSNRQCFSHVEILNLMQMFGFQVVDLFVLQQSSLPVMRDGVQKTGRKNQSYFLVGKFRR